MSLSPFKMRNSRQLTRLLNRPALIGTVLALIGPGQLIGQVRGRVGIEEIRTPGIISPRPSVDPADAVILSQEDFRALDVVRRRSIMGAWANGAPQSAGPSILPLIDAALKDRDPIVLGNALQVLQVIEGAANEAQLQRRKAETNVRLYPQIFQTLRELLDYPDPVFRADIVTRLTLFELPQSEKLITEFVRRRPIEKSQIVRTRLLTGIAEGARLGYKDAMASLIASLDDAELRLSAMNALGRIKSSQGLPKITALLAVQQPLSVRRAVIAALGRYGTEARTTLPALKSYLPLETDKNLKSQLQTLIAKLEQPSTAPR